MKDQLEEFIQKNRPALMTRNRPKKCGRTLNRLWRLSAKRGWNAVVWWRAAAIIFMALSAYLLIPKEATNCKL